MDHRTGLFTQIMRILPGASFRVLTALLLSQERLTQVRLQAITANSDKTISKALDRLRELGLAKCYYPGWEATDLARRLAEQAGLCQAQPEQQIPPAADSAGRNNSGSVTASARENPVQPASQVAHPARVGDSPGQSFSTSQPAQAQDRQPQQASGQVPIPGRVEPVADSAGRNNSGSVTASTRENPVQPAPQVAHPARVGDSPGRSFSASQPAQAQDRQPQQASGQVLPVQQGVLPGEIPVSRKVSDSPAPTTTNTKNLLINTESLLVVAGGKGRRFSDLFEITLQAGQPPPGDQPVRPCGKLPGFPACSGFARQQACEGRPAYPRQPVQAQPAALRLSCNSPSPPPVGLQGPHPGSSPDPIRFVSEERIPGSPHPVRPGTGTSPSRSFLIPHPHAVPEIWVWGTGGRYILLTCSPKSRSSPLSSRSIAQSPPLCYNHAHAIPGLPPSPSCAIDRTPYRAGLVFSRLSRQAGRSITYHPGAPR